MVCVCPGSVSGNPHSPPRRSDGGRFEKRQALRLHRPHGHQPGGSEAYYRRGAPFGQKLHDDGTPFTEAYTYAYVGQNIDGYQGYHDSSDYAYAFGYALRLSDTEPEPNSKEYFHKEVKDSGVWHDEKKLWMKELWPDWEAFIQPAYGFVGDAEVPPQ